MRKTNIPNKLSTNCKPIHGGQRVCEENKLELEKTKSCWNILRWKDWLWKAVEE